MYTEHPNTPNRVKSTLDLSCLVKLCCQFSVVGVQNNCRRIPTCGTFENTRNKRTLGKKLEKRTFVRSNASTLHNSHYHHQYQVLSIRTMLMYKWALDGTQTSLVQDLLAHDVKTVPSVAYK